MKNTLKALGILGLAVFAAPAIAYGSPGGDGVSCMSLCLQKNLGSFFANPTAVTASCTLTCTANQGDFCGGIAGFPCPEGYTCVDDPSDDCDPTRGGADCGGICRRSGGSA